MIQNTSISHIFGIIVSTIAAFIGLTAALSTGLAYLDSSSVKPATTALAEESVPQKQKPQEKSSTNGSSPHANPENIDGLDQLTVSPTRYTFIQPTGVRRALSTQDVNISVSADTPKEVHKQAQRRAQQTNGGTPVMTATDKEEILWLARIIYSETKRANEQRLVAWVVRNRVDTGYTGHTYRAVATHSAQFSGLHPSNPQYEHNMSRYWASDGEHWETALKIAKEVYFAPEDARPFSVATRHFYSPVNVYGTPEWAQGRTAVRVIRGSRHTEPRFAFFARVQ